MKLIFAETVLTERPNVINGRVFFPNLDGLRFAAFLLVYLQHGLNVPAAAALDHYGEIFERLRGAVFASGWAGVSFFFVLSGFLITYLILTEIRVSGRIDVLAFYARRILRIWPLYFIVLFFAFWIYPPAKQLLGYSPYIEAGKPLLYLLFLANFEVIRLGGQGAMSTNITWSVAIEEQFYLVWPLLFFLLRASLYRYVFVLIIIGSTAFRWSHLGDKAILYFASLSVISDMAVGGLAAYLAIHSGRFRTFFEHAPRRLICEVYFLGALALVFRHEIFHSAVALALERLSFAVLFAFILLEQNFSRHSVIKMGDCETASSLGKYTYGLYLLHPVALLILMGSSRALGISTRGVGSGVAFGLSGLVLSIALSYLSYHGIEKHFLHFKGRFTHVVNSGQTTGNC
jgi:peptidoglycan/LPS O-acetylase OafA/YrhL